MRSLALLLVVACTLLGACSTDSVSGTALPNATVRAVDPCALLSADQRSTLGLGIGRPTDSPLPDVAFCGWRTSERRADFVEAAIYPSVYELSRVRANYPEPLELSVAGLPAFSSSSTPSLTDRSCMIFVELPDRRLAMVSTFWEGTPQKSTHKSVCSRATSALGMVLDTLRSR